MKRMTITESKETPAKTDTYLAHFAITIVGVVASVMGVISGSVGWAVYAYHINRGATPIGAFRESFPEIMGAIACLTIVSVMIVLTAVLKMMAARERL
jgi:hypothetical protein